MRKGQKLGRPCRRKGEDLWTFIERMTTPEPNSGCLLWMGSTDSDDYGHMKVNGRFHRVPRIAYTEKVGPIADGMHVLHRCDVPLCVNPNHLFLGTNADNVADRSQKGRQAYGERHGRVKLTAAAVAAIRALQGTATQREIGRLFGVSDTLIRFIHEGKRRAYWRHI